MIKYLKGTVIEVSLQSIAGQGQLIYVDREKAVLAFEKGLYLNLAANEANRKEIAVAFQYALGYVVSVEVVDSATDVFIEYKTASGVGSNKAVPPKRDSVCNCCTVNASTGRSSVTR